ncbi:hypothetical protein KM043_006032 [Ampulex compressa]|nr:hypothetical protein KM043_006032 [Ampulex compressa]
MGPAMRKKFNHESTRSKPGKDYEAKNLTNAALNPERTRTGLACHRSFKPSRASAALRLIRLFPSVSPPRGSGWDVGKREREELASRREGEGQGSERGDGRGKRHGQTAITTKEYASTFHRKHFEASSGKAAGRLWVFQPPRGPQPPRGFAAPRRWKARFLPEPWHSA